MVSEFGHFLLISAFCLNLGLIANYLTRKPAFWGLVVLFNRLESLLLTLLAISFLFLIISFITSDFSVKLVANNSHSLKPILYKVAGTWGNHEGSMLLWVLILSLYLFLFQLSSNNYPKELVRNILLVQLSIIALFLFYLLFLSNPFERLNFPPLNGQDLNPILQDVLLVAHPPILYLGYLGLSIPFSIAIGLLLTNDNTTNIVKLIRFWALVPFVFLTLGILLGSIWAYYELGWGGWWFWDPVENASLMPWLIATALMHSSSVTEKTGTIVTWTILLSIAAFSLSLLGTFLVRSGVLTSVHAFATDPERGVFLLVMLALFVGGSLFLFAFKGHKLVSNQNANGWTRELLLVINNMLLVSMTIIVLIGTLYPLVSDILDLGKISVGPPYFDFFFVPTTVVLAIFMGMSASSRWSTSNLSESMKRVILPLMIFLR